MQILRFAQDDRKPAWDERIESLFVEEEVKEADRSKDRTNNFLIFNYFYSSPRILSLTFFPSIV